MNLETRTVELEYLELRDDDDGSHHLVGIVAPWHSTFDAGDYIEQFAKTVFDKSIAERGTKIPLLEQHDRNRHPVGMSMSWENTNDGLVADFRLANTPRADESRQLVVDNMVTGLSVAFQPIRNRTETRDGRRHVQRLEARLDHVGLVTSSAYSEAKVLAVRAYDPDDPHVAPRLAKWRHLLAG
jgi:HK97 family phage prohead protease